MTALFLASCFDSHEEVWINRDGSGRAHIRANIPHAATRLNGGEPGIRKIIEDYLADTPALKNPQLQTKIVENQLHIDFRASFKNAMELSELTSGEAAQNLPPIATKLLGTTTVAINGLSIKFHRQLDIGKAIPGAAFIPASQLRGHHLTTILHLPEPATTQNATETKNNNRTLIWRTPLNKALRQPIDTTFTMPLPIPWALVSIIIIGTILILALAIRLLTRRRRTAQTA